MCKEKEFLTCRRILSLMVMFCFILEYAQRVNISIAIVAMTSTNSSKTTQPYFDWNEEQKNNILGSYYIGYMLTAILAGRLSDIYGGKIVMGTAMFLSSILTLSAPTLAALHYRWLVASRVILGMCLAMFWPSIPSMAVRWVPVTERSKFIALTTTCSMGMVLTYPTSGFLIAHFGWPSVFYMTGGLPLLWVIAWCYLIYDTPQKHPRISKQELEELETVTIDLNPLKSCKTSWSRIFTAKPVWAIIVANSTALITYFCILSELPTYMHQIHHLPIQENGFLSGLPYLASIASASISSYLADKLIKKEKFRVIVIRKFFTGITLFGAALLFLVQVIWGYNSIISMFVFILYFVCSGCCTCGYYPNCLDIAPACAGTIFGIGDTIGAFGGFASTKLVTLFTRDQQTFEQWNYVFLVLVAMNVIATIIYMTFASADLQNWCSESCTSEMENFNMENVLKTEMKK